MLQLKYAKVRKNPAPILNLYNVLILTISYDINFTTSWLLKIRYMTICVVKCIVIQINGQYYGSINTDRG